MSSNLNRRDLLQAGLGLGAALQAGPALAQPAADPLALPPLPYGLDALAPHVSRETLEIHHGRHHKAYLDNLRKLVEADATLQGQPLEAIVRRAAAGGGPLFNNAAQCWNHGFFWQSMRPGGGGEPGGELAAAIARRFGGMAGFRETFTKAALGNFGSGWTWLVKKTDGSVDIVNTSNAATPITGADRPLLTLDVWEHAYYVDYRSARGRFIEAFLGALANWPFAEANFRA